MNFRRSLLIISIVLLFLIMFLPSVNAKHIIIIYDISGSMYKLGDRVFMRSSDVQRLNAYLTGILFSDISQELRDQNDSYIKECGPSYAGKPLYHEGERLTYCEYASRGDTQLKRQKSVSRQSLMQQLPNPNNLKQSFHGQVSYLLRAETEVYDNLYSQGEETYWIFVTDGDVDNSGKSDPEVASVLKRLAAIEDEYYSPMIFGLFVNNHVKIEVRAIEIRTEISRIFITSLTNPDEPIKRLQFSSSQKVFGRESRGFSSEARERATDGKFTSETLVVDTENIQKGQFRLDRVNIEVLGEDNSPLPIEVETVSLKDRSPPCKFQIVLPNSAKIANPVNKLQVEVVYSYNGKSMTYSPYPLSYTAVIDSIYLADLKKPDQKIKEVELYFSKEKEKYFGRLFLKTESPNQSAFTIDQIRAEIQYRDTNKLCGANVPSVPSKLDEEFQVEVPKKDNLDHYKNKLVLAVDYQYEGNKKSGEIAVLYKLHDPFPWWIFIILLIIVVGIGSYFLIRYIIDNVVKAPSAPIDITLTQVSASGNPTGNSRPYTLYPEKIISLGAGNKDELIFDVGSSSFLYHDGKNIIFYEDDEDEDGRILDSEETLNLMNDVGDDVYVKFEAVEDEPVTEELDFPDELPIDDSSILDS